MVAIFALIGVFAVVPAIAVTALVIWHRRNLAAERLAHEVIERARASLEHTR